MTTALDYQPPAVDLDVRQRGLAMAFWIFVVAIVMIVVLGGVAIFCILKGKRLAWSSKGWFFFTIACQ